MQPTMNISSAARRAYQVKEAVATYRLSKSTIYKLMAAGALRSVKIGGRRLIPVEALEALIRGGTDDPAFQRLR
jgi:excisionase family DNA binding protein